jgi:Asp-tRNA(Asn)/Glu-tRNA(Gln) amidotransferase A subunit family amidase
MSLDEEYPKTHRDYLGNLRVLLAKDTGLDPEVRDEVATAINDLADKARDLEEIVQRLLTEPHSPAEVGELLIALELTTEQIRGESDLIDGKLYEIGDRLRGVAPAGEA